MENNERTRLSEVKRLKGAELGRPWGALAVRTGHVNAKNGTATEEIIDEEANVFGQRTSSANFVHRSWSVFFSKETDFCEYEWTCCASWRCYKTRTAVLLFL